MRVPLTKAQRRVLQEMAAGNAIHVHAKTARALVRDGLIVRGPDGAAGLRLNLRPLWWVYVITDAGRKALAEPPPKRRVLTVRKKKWSSLK